MEKNRYLVVVTTYTDTRDYTGTERLQIRTCSTHSSRTKILLPPPSRLVEVLFFHQFIRSFNRLSVIKISQKVLHVV